MDNLNIDNFWGEELKKLDKLINLSMMKLRILPALMLTNEEGILDTLSIVADVQIPIYDMSLITNNRYPSNGVYTYYIQPRMNILRKIKLGVSRIKVWVNYKLVHSNLDLSEDIEIVEKLIKECDEYLLLSSPVHY